MPSHQRDGTPQDESTIHGHLTVALAREIPELPMHEWFRLPFSHEFVRATDGLPAHLVAEAILREVLQEVGGPPGYVERRRLLGSRTG